MLRLNVLFYFLLCLRLTVGTESGNQSEMHEVTKNDIVLSTAAKQSVIAITNTTSTGEDSDKISTFSNNHGNNSGHKEELKPQNNVTTGETRLPGNIETMNFGALIRGFYVFLGLSVIVIMYFTVRAIRLGRKKTKVKKYGILASREDLEMAPLGAEDDEEDTTVFDLSSHPGH